MKGEQIDDTSIPVIDLKSDKSTSSPTKTLKRPLVTDGSLNSPKKLRLDIAPASINCMYATKQTKKSTFKYGNYDRYYGYRNANDFTDIRLKAFGNHRSLFEGCNVLDIGCNNGLITINVARALNVKHIVGIDIDKRLVEKARKFLSNEKRNSNANQETFPFNVALKIGNYVLADEQLLELEVEQFDTILCLSVTKWIHLNSGDAGIKLAFRRMFKQLLPGGRLILEAQDWKSYKRRKNLTPDIATTYKSIKFFPQEFDEYLLGNEVGFERFYLIELPKHEAKGFQRPIKFFVKKSQS